MLTVIAAFLLQGDDVHLAHLHHFPPGNLYPFTRKTKDRLEANRHNWPHLWYLYFQAIEECNHAGAAWDLLNDARSPEHDERYRLHKLRELRWLLGDADYFSGRMPFPARWTFREMVR